MWRRGNYGSRLFQSTAIGIHPLMWTRSILLNETLTLLVILLHFVLLLHFLVLLIFLHNPNHLPLPVFTCINSFLLFTLFVLLVFVLCPIDSSSCPRPVFSFPSFVVLLLFVHNPNHLLPAFFLSTCFTLSCFPHFLSHHVFFSTPIDSSFLSSSCFPLSNISSSTPLYSPLYYPLLNILSFLVYSSLSS